MSDAMRDRALADLAEAARARIRHVFAPALAQPRRHLGRTRRCSRLCWCWLWCGSRSPATRLLGGIGQLGNHRR